MGGCVLSTLQKRNQWSAQEDKEITAFSNYGPLTKAVPNSETSNSSAIYRNGKYSTDAAIDKFKKDAITTLLPSVIKEVCAEEPNREICRYRSVLSVTKEDPPIPTLFSSNTTKLDVYNMSDPIGVSYRTFWSTIRGVGSGLVAAGVPHRGNVCIFEDTRWEWMAAVFAIWTQDFVACTVYANLGVDALYYALKETEASAIICHGKSVPLLLKGIGAGLLPPCVIVYLDELIGGPIEETHGCTVFSWEEVIEKGRQNPAEERLPTDPDTTALIMYTSGTTGDPKGVIHTHGSFTTGVQCLSNWVLGNITPQPDDQFISFLPLAHILALGVVCIFFSYKVLVCFGTPRTLTDATARPAGDLSTFKPTIIIGVPRIFDTIRRNVMVRLPKTGSFARNVFEQAYIARREAMKKGNDTPYYNEMIFKQARTALGGRLRLILAGGGPISEDTQDFIRVIFGKAVVGWGLTETVCVGAVQQLGDITNGNAGLPLISAEIKLQDTEDYKHTDQPEPRGELCIRGPFLFKGYYKQPELTKEAIDEDGWFHTGDVGSLAEGGRIKIVGRIKALAKNCLGEYIALETLESIYAAHPLVANNCICVLVHPNRNYIGAVLVTDEEKVLAFAQKHKINLTRDDPLKDAALQKKVVEEFTALAKSAHRLPFEFIKKVILTTGEWTPDNGILTAAAKLKRRVIDEKYKEEIEQLFEGE